MSKRIVIRRGVLEPVADNDAVIKYAAALCAVKDGGWSEAEALEYARGRRPWQLDLAHRAEAGLPRAPSKAVDTLLNVENVNTMRAIVSGAHEQTRAGVDARIEQSFREASELLGPGRAFVGVDTGREPASTSTIWPITRLSEDHIILGPPMLEGRVETAQERARRTDTFDYATAVNTLDANRDTVLKTTWERGFILSMKTCITVGAELTGAMRASIRRIYRRELPTINGAMEESD